MNRYKYLCNHPHPEVKQGLISESKALLRALVPTIVKWLEDLSKR